MDCLVVILFIVAVVLKLKQRDMAIKKHLGMKVMYKVEPGDK